MKTDRQRVVVVGLGEVGKPLFELASKYHDTVGVDVSPVGPVGGVDVMHVCFPFQIKDFVGEAARYIELYHPEVTVINSTVAIGTTRAVADRTGVDVVNSPIRGKHARMLEEISVYTKFVGALNPIAGERAARHFQSLGMRTRVLSSPEASELAKLTETTYFGLLIAWAQEVERFCDETGQKYDEVVAIYEEIKFFPPVKYFPGVIGGHCVMPNIEILRKRYQSILLEAIQQSNDMKVEREFSRTASVASV
jgi:UDP-N-acetyl-D-mannosaminuronate dehydrogenase